jgi:hypothetical protein
MAILGKRYEDMLAAFERLSRRERFMVGGLAVCFTIFVGFLVSMWISSSLGGLERRIADKTDKLQTIIDMRQAYDQAEERRKKAEELIKRARKIKLMGTLENLAQQLGIDTNDMKMDSRSPTSNPESKIEEKKVEVEMPRITIDRLVDFLDQIERKSESITVRKLQIRNNFKDPSQLDVRFTVSKFQLKDETGPPPTGAAATKSP